MTSGTQPAGFELQPERRRRPSTTPPTRSAVLTDDANDRLGSIIYKTPIVTDTVDVQFDFPHPPTPTPITPTAWRWC